MSKQPRGRPLPFGCLLFALAASSLAAPSSASEPSPLVFSGFATVGAVYTFQDDARFIRWGVNHPNAENPDFNPDSVLGLQASLRLSPYNEITVQALARQDANERYGPKLGLAFFSQSLAPGLSLRVGRLRVPFFMLSDSVNINYSNPWVRPPVEVYGLNPFNELDGGDLLYHARWGGLDLEVHPYYGRARIPTPEGEARLRDVWGLNLVATRGNWSVHAGHATATLGFVRGDSVFQALSAGMRAIGRGAVLEDLTGSRGKATFDSLGFQWDDGTWQLIGEYAQRRATRYAHSAHGWYLSAGRRFGPLMPYAVVARQQLDRPMAKTTIPPQFPGLAAGWEAFLTSRNNAQKSFTVGVRWDVARTAALKAEFTRARPDKNSWGSYFPQGDPVATRIGGRSIDTLSVSLDLSF